MARLTEIKILRTLRTFLDDQAFFGGILQGEPYLITDENRFAVGLTASTYQTFAKHSEVLAKQDTLGSGTNIKTINGASILGAGDLSTVSIPAGTSTEIQYNNAGAFGASANFTYDNVSNTLSLLGVTPTLELKSVTTSPVTPASGTLKLYAESIASKVLPKFIMPSGESTYLQQSLMFNSLVLVRPASGNAQTVVGTTISNVGTLSTPTLASTNLLSSSKRTLFTAAATTAGTLVSQRPATTIMWRGNAVGLGGFLYNETFALSTLSVSQRAFIGISDTTAAPTNIDPLSATTPGKIGLAVNTNTGNWNLVHNSSGSVPTVTSLGASFPVNITDVISLTLFSPPNGNFIGFKIKNITSGLETKGELTTNLPTNATFLLPWKFMTNNTATATFAFLSLGWTVEAAN